MRKHFSLAVATLAAIAVTGCGGSNRSAGYSGFVAQLNSLCSLASSAVGAAGGESAKAAVAATFQSRFQALNPPSELKSIYDQWTSATAQAISSLKNGDQATAKTLVSQANTLASSLGAAQCANANG